MERGDVAEVVVEAEELRSLQPDRGERPEHRPGALLQHHEPVPPARVGKDDPLVPLLDGGVLPRAVREERREHQVVPGTEPARRRLAEFAGQERLQSRSRS